MNEAKRGFSQGHSKIFHFDSSTWRKIAPKINRSPSFAQRIFAFGHSGVLPIINLGRIAPNLIKLAGCSY
jgi:hypothetical protein